MWYLFYGLIDLSDDQVLIEAMNQAVEKNKEDAMINFKIKNTTCFMDLFILLSYVPIWPTCNQIKISGEVVKAK